MTNFLEPGTQVRLIATLSSPDGPLEPGTKGTVLADSEEIELIRWFEDEIAIRFEGVSDDDWWYARPGDLGEVFEVVA